MKSDWSRSIENPELRAPLEEIIRRAPADLAAIVGRKLPEEALETLTRDALASLQQKLETTPARRHEDLARAWNQTVEEIHGQSDRLKALAQTPPKNNYPPTSAKSDSKLKEYLRVFLVPTLLTKTMILYFGLNYAMYPGEGYGWGLAASISLTFASFAYFVWVNRNETEDT